MPCPTPLWHPPRVDGMPHRHIFWGSMSRNILAAVAVSAAAICLLAGALQLQQQDVGNSVDGFPRFVPLLSCPQGWPSLPPSFCL